jgi:hypothetical protein
MPSSTPRPSDPRRSTASGQPSPPRPSRRPASHRPERSRPGASQSPPGPGERDVPAEPFRDARTSPLVALAVAVIAIGSFGLTLYLIALSLP